MRGLHFKALTFVVIGLAVGAISAFSQTTLVTPTNSVWKFYTNSAGYNVDPGFGTTWKEAGYDDTAWYSGVGLFGNDTGYPYGFTTPIAGPSANANTGPITVYYRIHFNWVGSTAGVIFTGTNYIDDGNIVYLNGIEITRFNMPAGDATWVTTAPVANPVGFPNVNGSTTAGEPCLVRMDIPLDSLTNGNANPLVVNDNVIEVEVHNQSSTSSDHVFGMSIFASQQICPTTDGSQPTNRTVLENTSSTLIVNGSGVPSPTYQWYRNLGGGAGDEIIVGATTPTYTITNMTAGDAGEYFARLQNTCVTPVDSRRAVVAYQADTNAPTFVYAECGANADEIVIGLSEPLIVDNGMGGTLTDEFNWLIEKITGPGGDPGPPADVVYTLGTTTILLTAGAGLLDPLATYRVKLLAPMLDTAAIPNTLPANSSVTNECPLNISVLAAGAGPFTFARPPFAKQFTTFTWSGGANGVGDTLAAFVAKVQLLDATLITTPLASVAGAPPAAAGQAQYASAGQYLITRPTGVEGEVILAHLQNDSGQTRVGLDVAYNLRVEIPVAEEVPGHHVFYSVSGSPNTWLEASTILSPDTVVSGPVKVRLDLRGTPWTVGSPLYLLWADDNGSGSPDNANEIDNVVISHTGPPLVITYSSPNITITWTPGTGTLQFKDDILGTWADVTPTPAAGGPYTVAASAAHRYYSLRP